VKIAVSRGKARYDIGPQTGCYALARSASRRTVCGKPCLDYKPGIPPTPWPYAALELGSLVLILGGWPAANARSLASSGSA
jgi:hypothetical protein